MKTFMSFFGAAACALLLAGSAAAQQAPTKVGYIDSRRVIQEAPGAQAARQTIETEMGAYQQQLRMLEDSVRTMFDQYQQQSVMMSPDAKAKREQEITAKQGELQQRATEIQQRAVQRQNELMEPIMARIEQIISTVRTEGGYAILFDVASDALVSADTTLDVTEQVIARLRAASAPSGSN